MTWIFLHAHRCGSVTRNTYGTRNVLCRENHTFGLLHIIFPISKKTGKNLKTISIEVLSRSCFFWEIKYVCVTDRVIVRPYKKTRNEVKLGYFRKKKKTVDKSSHACAIREIRKIIFHTWNLRPPPFPTHTCIADARWRKDICDVADSDGSVDGCPERRNPEDAFRSVQPFCRINSL